MSKTDRGILIANDQAFGMIADPNKLEASITHAYDKIDENYDELISKETNLQNQITMNLNRFNTHKNAAELDHPDKSVTERKIQDNAVTRNKIKDGEVTTNKLEDYSVTTSKIQYNAVTTEKIAKGAVTNDKLADNSVSTAKIVNGSVTREKIASGAVGRNELDSTLWEQTANNAKFQEIDDKIGTLFDLIVGIDCGLFTDTVGTGADIDCGLFTDSNNEFDLDGGAF